MSAPDSPNTHPGEESIPWTERAPSRGLAAASVGLGFFSLVVFWWFPFGLFLSIVGLALGLVCMALGIRGGLRGENLALVGTMLSGSGLVVIMTVARGARMIIGGY
jgi:hypothetical protein